MNSNAKNESVKICICVVLLGFINHRIKT